MHRLTLTLTLVLLPVTRVAAQHQMPSSDTDSGPVIHGRAFSTGTREGWTFSTPHLDINGGLHDVDTGGGRISQAFFRLHLQSALGIHLARWVQGTVAVRPIHELTPFVQMGKALTTGNKAEFLLGIAHPLAPYKLHFP